MDRAPRHEPQPGWKARAAAILAALLCCLVAAGTESVLGGACSAADVQSLPACQVADGSAVMDTVSVAGETQRYSLVTTESLTRLKIELADLTGDLDLYLTDDLNGTRGQSRLEGTFSESLDVTVEPGRYLIYVMADPGRPLAQPVSYTLRVSFSGPAVAAVAPLSNPAGPPPGSGAPNATGEKVRVVNANSGSVNLRAEPLTGADVVAQVGEGTVLDVIGPNREVDGRIWRNVRSSDGTSGWISSTFVATIRTATPP